MSSLVVYIHLVQSILYHIVCVLASRVLRHAGGHTWQLVGQLHLVPEHVDGYQPDLAERVEFIFVAFIQHDFQLQCVDVHIHTFEFPGLEITARVCVQTELAQPPEVVVAKIVPRQAVFGQAGEQFNFGRYFGLV